MKCDPNRIKIGIFFSKNYKKSPSGWVLRPQTPITSSGWGLRSHTPSVTCLSGTNLLTTSPNFDWIEKILTSGSSPSSTANPGYEPNQTPSFYSLSHKKSLFSKIFDDVNACDLRFSPPSNSKSRRRLCIKPCAICIPETGCCILILLAHLHEWLLTTLQRCKAIKYTLHCFQSKISLV